MPSQQENSQPLITHLDLELTERCNNNCVHCCINLPADNLAARKKELSTQEIKDILREAASLGCVSAQFSGGEPFLREDLEEIYVFTRKLGVVVKIFTNATLLTEHWADVLSRIPPLEEIQVTVYGMKRSSYEAVTRNPGSFEAAWQGIGLLLKKKISFVVAGVLLPQNKHEAAELEMWSKVHLGSHGPIPYRPFLDLSARGDLAKNDRIKALRVSPEEGVTFLARDKIAYMKEKQEYCSKFMRPGGTELFQCGSGLCGGCVDAYGIFQPCLLLRHPETSYDLRKGSLRDAMARFFPRVREMEASNPSYLMRCAVCFLKGLCEQCPGKSCAEHGTLDTPVNYLCDVAHAQARLLGFLKDGEKAWEIRDGERRVTAFSKRRIDDEVKSQS